MKFVSLICRGLASSRKKLALKRMMEVLSLEVIILQETMGPELEVETSLTSLLTQYSFRAQSAINHSGGRAIGWKKTSIRCTNSWCSPIGLGTHLCWGDTNTTLIVVSIYGPYSNRAYFWDSFKRAGFVKEKNLIIGGGSQFHSRSP